MRNLFLRIFIPVFIAVIAAFAFGFVLSDRLRPRRPAPDERAVQDRRPPPGEGRRMRLGPRTPFGGRFVEERRELTTYLNQGDIAAAQTLVRRLNRRPGVSLFVVSEDGKDLLDRKLSDRHQRMAEQAKRRDGPSLRESGRIVFVASPLHTNSGEEYVLVGEFDRSIISSMRWLTSQSLLFLAVVLSLAVTCYLIARHLAKPILMLRGAVNRFSEGDLNQRTSSLLGKRRDELAELARDFDQMAERIAILLDSQRRLLQDVSHELRSPLARQSIALELARERAGPDAQSALERVDRESQRLGSLVAELLTLTRLEGESGHVERVPVALDDLLGEVAGDANFEAGNNTNLIRVIASDSTTIVGVPELLRRAIENVVRNAVKYNPPDATVDLELSRESGDVVIRVRDHGPGVPDEELSKIFKPFYRVSTARDRESGGSGLGLAIADRAIRSHGGTVSADNAPDGGLIVEIRIPIAAEP